MDEFLCRHARIAEMNQQLAENLDRMIGELRDGPDQIEGAADAG
ncbi:hypothetical protein OIE68_08925 [Nocardia vinacea]|nr:hypothetical protein OIE68_08925 [Nocardia vinacea]